MSQTVLRQLRSVERFLSDSPTSDFTRAEIDGGSGNDWLHGGSGSDESTSREFVRLGEAFLA